MDLPTRKEYIDGKVTFAEFYGSVAKEAGIDMRGSHILPKAKAALANGDEHLNTIPLITWDSMAMGAQSQITRSLKLHGDFYSLAGGVCTMKQAVKDAIAKQDGRSF